LDGARILKLDSPASDVVIGNPNIADVTVQTPNRLVIIGRAPGVTRLIVMSDGAITMDTQVVVAAKNASAQVSVLAPDGGNITETIFACGDRCTVVPGTKRRWRRWRRWRWQRRWCDPDRADGGPDSPALARRRRRALLLKGRRSES
jgi:hypothetical protein